jgi:hypothetical protein
MKTIMGNGNCSGHTRLNCEQLESRSNPSNISVSFSANTLAITGGPAIHQYTVEETSGGDFLIIGQNGTTVNGKAEINYGKINVSNLNINDGNGSNRITVIGVHVSDGFNLTTGNGNDVVTLDDVVATNITVHEEGGNNVLTTTGVIGINSAAIDAGSGFNIWYDNSVLAGNSLTYKGWSEIQG